MRNSVMPLKLRFCYLLFIISIGLSAWASEKEITRPPRDDSERSSVRLNTNWKPHSLGQTGCLERAQTLLTRAKYFVEVGERSAFGTREGMTFSVRCDYEGVAFFAAAYRHRLTVEAENLKMNEIVEEF